MRVSQSSSSHHSRTPGPDILPARDAPDLILTAPLLPEKRSAPAPNTGTLQFLYQNPLGQRIRPILAKPWTSRLIGRFMDSSWSKVFIQRFINSYGIDLSEYEAPADGQYKSFNDFFIRKIRPSARPIDPDPCSLACPADGRLLAFPHITKGLQFAIKGLALDLVRFVGPELAHQFHGGTMLVVRLGPENYHRFHFPVAGVPAEPREVRGILESVDSQVYEAGLMPLATNQRHILILSTETFGPIAIIPVGAMAVGKIVETYTPSQLAPKGGEAGYFKFGGSTVVLLLEPGRIELPSAIINASRLGQETVVKLGEAIGRSKAAPQTSTKRKKTPAEGIRQRPAKRSRNTPAVGRP